MVNIKCETAVTRKLHELKPFQGELKKRTSADIEALKQSILTEGLIMPIAVWGEYILDGHGRYEVLKDIAPDIEVPVVEIEAATEEEARKQLLQIVSVYGKINKAGLVKFTAAIPEYKAAPVMKITAPIIKRQPVQGELRESDDVIIRLKIKKTVAGKLIEMLSQTEGVEVL
jgi:hypothetical protein